MVYVPWWQRYEIEQVVKRHFAGIYEEIERKVSPESLPSTREMIQRHEGKTLSEMAPLFNEEREGAGFIKVFSVPGSPLHNGLLKVTAVSFGAERHRTARLRGETLSLLEVHSRYFTKRLWAERLIHRELKEHRCEEVKIKWYRASADVITTVIDDLWLKADR